MGAALLASWLITQTWAWTPVADTDVVAYRLYWGASGQAWCATNRVEVPITACVANECQAEIPQPTIDLAFIMVVAVDAAGNVSNTEHGPIVTCP